MYIYTISGPLPFTECGPARNCCVKGGDLHGDLTTEKIKVIPKKIEQ